MKVTYVAGKNAANNQRGFTQINRIGQTLPDNAPVKGHPTSFTSGRNIPNCQAEPDLHKRQTSSLALEGEGGTQCRVRGKNNKGCLIDTPSSARWASSPSRGKQPAFGFTLIELLVVVLIIGILAAVALPQYNKVVLKARFAEAITILNAIKKAKDVCILAGKNSCDMPDKWDVEIPGAQENAYGILTPFFHFTGADADMGLPGPAAGYLKEKVCLCYYDGTEDGSGQHAQLVLSQGGGSCAGAAEPSYNYAELLNIPLAEEDTCGCC